MDRLALISSSKMLAIMMQLEDLLSQFLFLRKILEMSRMSRSDITVRNRKREKDDDDIGVLIV